MESFLLLIPLTLIVILLWFNAGKLYTLHSNIQRKSPLLFKIIGFNERYLGNSDLWIKYFRIYLVLFSVFFLALIVFLIIGL